jgi:hypothetical protein
MGRGVKKAGAVGSIHAVLEYQSYCAPAIRLGSARRQNGLCTMAVTDSQSTVITGYNPTWFDASNVSRSSPGIDLSIIPVKLDHATYD